MRDAYQDTLYQCKLRDVAEKNPDSSVAKVAEHLNSKINQIIHYQDMYHLRFKRF